MVVHFLYQSAPLDAAELLLRNARYSTGSGAPLYTASTLPSQLKEEFSNMAFNIANVEGDDKNNVSFYYLLNDKGVHVFKAPQDVVHLGAMSVHVPVYLTGRKSFTAEATGKLATVQAFKVACHDANDKIDAVPSGQYRQIADGDISADALRFITFFR